MENKSETSDKHGVFPGYRHLNCRMYSIVSSVNAEGFTCDKCREIVRLTEKISELKTRIPALIEDGNSEM